MIRCNQKKRMTQVIFLLGALCVSKQALSEFSFGADQIEGSAGLQIGAAALSTKGVNFGLGQVDFRTGKNKGNEANWLEAFVKPSFTLKYHLSESANLLVGGSIINTHTFGDGDAGGFTRDGDGRTSLEELYAGFRYKDWSLIAGRQQYVIGNGFIVADGHLGMLEEGAYWGDPRRAFKDTVILRYVGKSLSAQAFTIRTDKHLGETKISGFNFDYQLSFARPGATYMVVDDVDTQSNQISPKDGMKVYDFRLLELKIPHLPNLKMDAEYALQRGSGKGIKFDASAWYTKAEYQFTWLPVKPDFTYRYAEFSGDSDPTDSTRKNWDPLAKGYMQRGAWVIGDITGNFLLNNSNEIVHMWKIAAPLNPALGSGIAYYKFRLDKKNYMGSLVSSKAFSDETAIYMDWTPSRNLYLTFSYNFARPKAAAKEVFGDKTFSAWQLYTSYTF